MFPSDVNPDMLIVTVVFMALFVVGYLLVRRVPSSKQSKKHKKKKKF